MATLPHYAYCTPTPPCYYFHIFSTIFCSSSHKKHPTDTDRKWSRGEIILSIPLERLGEAGARIFTRTDDKSHTGEAYFIVKKQGAGFLILFPVFNGKATQQIHLPRLIYEEAIPVRHLPHHSQKASTLPLSSSNEQTSYPPHSSGNNSL